MGDSDDEYDRKRRDKFRGERAGNGGTEGNSYRGSDRREERTRGREEWQERDSWSGSRARGGRAEYRDYRGGGGGGGGARGYSPVRGEGGAPTKRMRPDWGALDDRRYASLHDTYGSYGWIHDTYGPHPAHQAYALHAQQPSIREGGLGGAASGETQPAMMSFKAFLASQDDAITDDDAIKKYNDYKLEFRRQQLNEFFVAHKDEEWFKIKYHPEESLKRKEEQQNSLKNRLRVFLDVLQNSYLDKITVDVEQSEQLIRLLDTVVIKLEGGTEEDLKVLDEQPKPAEPAPAAKPVQIILDGDSDDVVKKEKPQSDDEEEKKKGEKKAEEVKDKAPLSMDIDPHHVELQEQAKLFSSVNNTDKEAEPEAAKKPPAAAAPSGKRKRARNSGSSGSSSGSSSSSSSSSDSSDSDAEDGDKEPAASQPKEPEPQPPGHNDSTDKDQEKTEDGEAAMDSQNEEGEVKAEENSEKAAEEEDKSQKADKEEEEKKESTAMHKTTSIFLRNLSPTITKAEVEAMCKRYGGFLRVALADPLPERRWFRRGWVTFRREVNIKDICWNLNNIRLRDCELGAIVNRDLSRRIRPVSGVTLHKQVVRADARLAARLCHHLDAKAGLFTNKENSKSDDGPAQFGLVSSNPVLHNITEYLIEEGSAEEDELLGLGGASSEASSAAAGDGSTAAEEGAASGDTVERDAQLTSVLDRLILYLRVVHSVDYYNHCEYPYEDEMPNRCGIMHARGPAPSSKVTATEILEYNRVFEGKLSAFLQEPPTLAEEELTRLGTKDRQAEVEKFIQANTQELAKDKWLCPLSGKKFKGPDFIRKHIFNKHGEKVDEVKKEVEYFNNYLRDVKRPQLSEHPTAGRRPEPSHQPSSYSQSYGSGGYGGYGRGGFGGYHAPYGYAPSAYAPAAYAPPRHARSFARGRDTFVDRSRPVIAYNDLDLPENGDLF